MAGPSWLVDGSRIASKIRSACNHEKVKWQSNPTKTCPNCHHVIDNSDVAQQWPGLPRGVKFDPSDQEIILHLLAKVGVDGAKPHPFIDEFIPTVNKEGGICYTHPQNLPGVKQDGNSTHFFHRAIKAYNTGTRKRRKIQDDDFGGVRWHKTGRTKPVVIDGAHVGNKKIMVLYTSMSKGKAVKSNWVMHQYHLGTDEEELDGQYVISKIFIQQPQITKSEKPELFECDPSIPQSVTPEPSSERRGTPVECVEDVSFSAFCDELHPNEVGAEECVALEGAYSVSIELSAKESDEFVERNGENLEEENKWWEGESQALLDSQQLVEGLSICDEFLQSQSPGRGEVEVKPKVLLSEYAKLGAEHLKKDLEACEGFEFDPSNIELDTPPEFRLSQIDFGSQDSFLAWGGGK